MIAAIAVLGIGAVSTPIHRAAAVSAVDSGSGIGAETTATFNDPSTSPTAIRSLELRRLRLAQTEYAGSPGDVDASFFHLSDVRVAHQLLNVANDGGVVHVLLDGSNETLGCKGKTGCTNPAFTVLSQLNQLPGGSWVRTCSGCIGSQRNHNKFILISRSDFPTADNPGVGTDLVIQTSSNNTHTSYHQAFNDAIMTVGQPTVYADYLRYFDEIAHAATLPTQPSIRHFQSTFAYVADTTTLADHDIATWSFPRMPGDDPLASMLGGVSLANNCANTATTPGSPTTATVHVAMSRISGRPLIIEWLKALSFSGCDVQIVYARMGGKDRKALAGAGVGLHRLCVTTTDASTEPVYVHSKYILIAGTVFGLGTDVRAIYAGSDNFNNAGLRDTDDRMVRYVESADSAGVFTDYQRNFRSLKSLADSGTQSATGCTADD